ncbi:hypothetical protein TARUN_1150 [Trichoderma arundinaceum]|uniref:2EXR domain-containing protein n=1 Tax=Trichoderma arundinaceum TaxID=490622 RepID=A0A395NZ36_TRIAR|nr:hypothetical protein TARUN_1150 [Trichoderma arundinaceum]
MNDMSASIVESTKPMADTFHAFNKLPTEIQWMIWEFAARDFEKGVHFFTAAAIQEADEEVKDSNVYNADRAFGYSLAAPKPQHAPVSAQDWVDGNPSAYIRDAGLWTACYTSHMVMKERYEKLGLLVEKPNDEFPPFAGSQFRHSNETWHFQVCPLEDLLCIQPLHTTFPWSLMPFFEVPNSVHSGAWNKFKNMGLEYDPSWKDPSGPINRNMHQENSARGCFMRTLWAVAERHMTDGFVFWLIDRTSQRRVQPCQVYMPDDSDTELEEDLPEPRVFQGHGKRYVEVRDLSDCKYDALGQNTVFHYLHWLEFDVGFNIQYMMDHSRNPANGSRLVANHLTDLVGVLLEEPS